VEAYPDCREASPQAIVKLQFPRMNVISVPLGQQPPMLTCIPTESRPYCWFSVPNLRRCFTGTKLILWIRRRSKNKPAVIHPSCSDAIPCMARSVQRAQQAKKR
jgi:hypothetical protein